MTTQLESEYIELIGQHEGIIQKIIGLYVDSEEDKKDLRQEILMQGWSGFQRFKGQSKFSTWLYKVALNTALSYIKKQSKSAVMEHSKELIFEPKPKEDHEILYIIIRSFNEVDKMLVTLYLEGYKNKEIADITGMTQNNINVKIHRLKNEIIEKFKKINHG